MKNIMILNLRQITDKLNLEFASDQRKLIFWYDADAEFISDIDDMELENAKILRLERDNQFYIKYFLEREDVKTSYLIKKLGLADGPELDAAIQDALTKYGSSNRSKYRAVVYYLLCVHFGKQAVYA